MNVLSIEVPTLAVAMKSYLQAESFFIYLFSMFDNQCFIKNSDDIHCWLEYLYKGQDYSLSIILQLGMAGNQQYKDFNNNGSSPVKSSLTNKSKTQKLIF